MGTSSVPDTVGELEGITEPCGSFPEAAILSGRRTHPLAMTRFYRVQWARRRCRFSHCLSGKMVQGPSVRGCGTSTGSDVSEDTCERLLLHSHFSYKWSFPKIHFKEQGSHKMLRKKILGYSFCEKCYIMSLLAHHFYEITYEILL